MSRRLSVCVGLRARALATRLPRQTIVRPIVLILRIHFVPIHSVQNFWSGSRIISKRRRASSDWAFDTLGLAVIVVGNRGVLTAPAASMVIELLSAGIVIRCDQDEKCNGCR